MSLRASVVIPLYNQAELTKACLAALRRAGLAGVELVLVDNASTDDTSALLAGLDGTARVVRNRENLGFATACNQGAEAASGPVLVFLNNDTEVHQGWLEPLLEAVVDPDVGMAGARLLYPNGRVQHAGMALMPGCTPIHLHRGAPGDQPAVRATRDLLLVTGACLAVSRARFRDEGGFDATFRNGYEDADFCLRLASRGWVARYCGDSVVTHHEGMSAGRGDSESGNAVVFRRRWASWPSDWADRLAEDGVEGAEWADCVWSGPLFDGSPEAEAGVHQLESLTADGWRPLAREEVRGEVAPGAVCPPAVLAALNRIAAPVREVQALAGSQCPAGVPPARAAIGWWGPLFGRSGYARAGRGLLAAADAESVIVRHRAADALDPSLGPVFARRDELVDPQLWVAHHIPVGPDGVEYWREFLAATGRPVVGATCFETDGLPAGWAEAAAKVATEVWVPTAFNLRTFEAGGMDPDRLHAIPYPVDTDFFAPGGPVRGEGPVTFVSVFEWTWRKGWDVLLRAWVEEFEKHEGVRLRILTYRGAGALGQGDIIDQTMACIRNAGSEPDAIADIELILDPISDAALIEFYRSADAFVLPTRGEGAGMPIIEAMACGTPTIATAWGGHEELMDPELSFPVSVAGLVEASAQQVRDNSLYRGQRLAEPDLASLRIAMRSVAEDPAGARRRADAGRAAVEERFSIPAVGRALASRVEALTGGARIGVSA